MTAPAETAAPCEESLDARPRLWGLSFKLLGLLSLHIFVFFFSFVTEVLLFSGYVPLIPMVLVASPTLHIALCAAVFLFAGGEVSKNKSVHLQIRQFPHSA